PHHSHIFPPAPVLQVLHPFPERRQYLVMFFHTFLFLSIRIFNIGHSLFHLAQSCLNIFQSLSSLAVSLIEKTSAATTYNVALTFRISSMKLQSVWFSSAQLEDFIGLAGVLSGIGLVRIASLLLVAAPLKKLALLLLAIS
ncbi:hypothetical protein GOODEAATRI_034014, partial [Goodea atripinnis]